TLVPSPVTPPWDRSLFNRFAPGSTTSYVRLAFQLQITPRSPLKSRLRRPLLPFLRLRESVGRCPRRGPTATSLGASFYNELTLSCGLGLTATRGLHWGGLQIQAWSRRRQSRTASGKTPRCPIAPNIRRAAHDSHGIGAVGAVGRAQDGRETEDRGDVG